MTLPELCIRRPVMTTLIMVGLVIFGVFAYRTLPVAELPNVDFPTIQVSASLPGASPETMASSVAQPLEAQFSRIPGVDSMTSNSSLGQTQITLQFNLERSIDAAAQDVQTAISTASRYLPTEMPAPPSFRKVNPSDFSIYILALTSKTMPLTQVDTYAETILAQRLSSVTGVAQVVVFGAQKPAVRVQVDPDKLATYGIGFDEVVDGVKRANQNQATGTLSGADQTVTIKSSGQLTRAEDYNKQIVIYRNGAPVRVQDIGKAIDGVENNKIASWFNSERGIVLGVYRQPGANTIEVVDAVKAVLPQFQQILPASIKMDLLYDRTDTIRHSIADVQFTLVLAAALVIMVIFLFLRNVSATIIPSLALPISVVGTFAAMAILGYSLNNLTLMALTLSVGVVVDDAIVMLENIVRHMEKGEKPFAAAIKGSKEIAFTIISMTVSLGVVFIPVLFMGGMVGRLLHDFAVTICAAIVVSGIVSLTLTPMLCSRFVRPHGHHTQHNMVYRWSEWVLEGLKRSYDRSLQWCLRHHRITFCVFLATLASTVVLFQAVPKDFLPSEDNNQIIAFTEAAQDTSFEAMIRNQQKVAEVVLKNPNVAAFMSSVGAGGSRTTANSGTLFIRLKPRAERELNADQVINQLRPQLSGFPGVKVFMQNPPPIRIGGTLSKAQYQYTLQDLDLVELYKAATAMQDAMSKLGVLRDVTSDMYLTSPSVEQIQSALGAAFSSQQVSTIYTPSEQYQVIVEVMGQYQRDASALDKIYVRGSRGSLVPLAAVASLKNDVGPLTVSHLGQLPAVTISFNLAPDVSLGQAVDAVKKIERDMSMPITVTTAFQGTAKAFEASLKGMGLLVVMAILVVYIVLGVLYESFIHPLTILSGLPSAGVGALLTLLIFNTPLTLYAFVGMLLLIGIVKKNAIMMIDFALEAERKGGQTPQKAIYEACLVRFRPIMMTTLAALMGAIPIAIGIGGGAESRKPLGLAVVGGLMVSQLLTLFITPVLYLYLDRVRHFGWFRRIATAGAPPADILAHGVEADEIATEQPKRAAGGRPAE
ncbi:MAG: efflux RND transporter permease subunit [Alphaproteobacteria bacterium]|nr:efflux RND transporter permease subunit [Alphaproteobacteria bacterium]